MHDLIVIVEEALSRAQQLAIMADPKKWGRRFLALSRRPAGGGSPELAVMCDVRAYGGPTGFSATAFKCNLFMLPQSLAEMLRDVPREVFDTPEEMYAAGWRVD